MIEAGCQVFEKTYADTDAAPPPAIGQEGEAALRQFSLQRLMAYGVDYADARDLRARAAEEHNLYQLVVDWETIEHHIDAFRNSPGFARWREAVGPFFTAPPRVTHGVQVAGYF